MCNANNLPPFPDRIRLHHLRHWQITVFSTTAAARRTKKDPNRSAPNVRLCFKNTFSRPKRGYFHQNLPVSSTTGWRQSKYAATNMTYQRDVWNPEVHCWELLRILTTKSLHLTTNTLQFCLRWNRNCKLSETVDVVFWWLGGNVV